MADSEEKPTQEKPEEPQEEETTVHEASPEQPAETQVEQQPPEPPPEEKPITEPAPAPEPPAAPVEREKEEEKVETDKEKPPEDAPPGEDQKRRRSSTKRASIDAKAKSSAIAMDTFIPPEAKSMSVSSDRRASALPGMRRASVARSPSAARKSKFGGLSSKARMVLGSIVDIKGNVAEYFDKKAAKYQNTYQLESENPFNSEKVDKILKEVMNEIIENLQYDADKCASTAKFATTQIRTKVKQLEFDRYKLVCVVTIGEKNSQDVYATCRFLWNPEKDRHSFYSLENTHVYAIAYCFGLYYE